MKNINIIIDRERIVDYLTTPIRQNIRELFERGYKIKDVLEKILRRKKDNKNFIEPQKDNSNLVIRFFTDNEFDYTNLINKPNICCSNEYYKKYFEY